MANIDEMDGTGQGGERQLARTPSASPLQASGFPFGDLQIEDPVEEDFLDDDDNGELDIDHPDFPVIGNNPRFLVDEALLRATVNISKAAELQTEELAALRTNLPTSTGIQTAVKNALTDVVTELKQIAHGVNPAPPPPPVDNAILICVLSFDSDGEVFGGTDLGKALEACGTKTIHQLAGIESGKKADREAFVKRLTPPLARLEGFEKPIDETDVRRLLAIAPLVRDAVARVAAAKGSSTKTQN